ncbi:MAG TPA: hypothetical protein VGL59_22145 [Polyangia bacterium]|jgi:hypothetical protein
MVGALTLIGCSSGGGSSGGSGGAGSGGSGSGGRGSGGNTGSGGSGSGGSGSGGANVGSGGAAVGSGGAGGSATDAAMDAAIDAPASGDASGGTSMSFFITSDKSMTGNLGGLTGADKRCQDLATAVGAGSKTWHAYLSVAKGPDGTAVNAKDRIGNGPWYNVKGALIAMNVADLHTKNGDYMLFLDEKGGFINGHWTGSPAPVEHDILTGSNRDGTLDAANNCSDWTSAATTVKAWVGHSDGLGPAPTPMDPMYRPWNHSHLNMDCSNTAPLGGAGRIACFAVN